MKAFYTNISYKNDKMYVKGYNGDEPFVVKRDFNPYIFVENRDGDYKDMNGVPHKKKIFNTKNELYDYVTSTFNKYTGFGVGHKDVKQNEFIYPFISDIWKETVPYDLNKIKIFDFDIETTSHLGFPSVDDPQEEILSIACSVRFKGERQYVVFGQKEYHGNGDFEYVHCIDEETVLKKFLKFFKDSSPDVLTGWNSMLFDIPYLCSRIENVYNENWLVKLSPFGIKPKKGVKKVKFSKGATVKEFTIYRLYGVSHLDYIELYKKFTFVNRESYKLDHIAEVELGEKKIDYSEYGNLNRLYMQNWDLFIEYNFHDVKLVDGLVDKLKLIELCATIAYITKTNIEDSFSPIKSWEAHIYNRLIKDKIVFPLKDEKIDDKEKRGGRVKIPKIGFSDWVVTSDATSLYPSIIMSLNMSPDVYKGKINVNTDDILYKKLRTNNIEHSIAANGCMFDNKREGFLTTLISEGFSLRKKYKDKMIDLKIHHGDEDKIKEYDIFQHAIKIFLNSAYGIFGNDYFRFASADFAEAITVTGQVLIQVGEIAVNNYLNEYFNTVDKDYIVFSDTDSVAIELNDVFKKFDVKEDEKVDFIIDFYSKHIDPVLENAFDDFSKYCNYYKNKISFKREKVAENVVITAKKRYGMLVWDSEGERFETPELIYKGLEIVRSNTPNVVKQPLRDCLRLILQKDENALHEFVKNFKKEYYSFEPEIIAIASGVSDLEKYLTPTGYGKKTPIYTKAAIIYNNLLERLEIANDYEKIRSGGKVKFVWLKKPNKIREEVVGFDEKIPKEFGVHNNIDYLSMYKKTFLKPLESITEKIGWTTEKITTLNI